MKTFLKVILLLVVLIGTFIGLLFYNALVIDTIVGWFYEEISYRLSTLIALVPTFILYRYSINTNKYDKAPNEYWECCGYIVGKTLGGIIFTSILWLIVFIVSLFI